MNNEQIHVELVSEKNFGKLMASERFTQFVHTI